MTTTSNHLGNVLTVITDNKIPKDSNTDEIAEEYHAFVLSASDYYPFGLAMEERNFKSDAYRYGFNGKENDTDWGGDLVQDYGFRIYMPVIAKFLSVDPLAPEYPELTTYQFASNTPIIAIDLDGLEAFYIHGTWAQSDTWATLEKKDFTDIHNATNNTTHHFFNWDGRNYHEDPNQPETGREYSANELVQMVLENRTGNEPITLVGHSHGGNVAVLAANKLAKMGIKVDYIVTINTPVRDDYQVSERTQSLGTKHIAISHKNDQVQLHGGNDKEIRRKGITYGERIDAPKGSGIIKRAWYAKFRLTGEMGSADWKFKDAVNILLSHNGLNPTNLKRDEFYNSHQDIDQINEWSRELDLVLKGGIFEKIKTKLNEIGKEIQNRWIDITQQ